MLSIQRTTRLSDENSGANDSNFRSKARSNTNRSKQFGVLTEMELEDTDESSIVRSAAHAPVSDNSSENSDIHSAKFPNTNRKPNGIHKTTRVTVTYGDAKDF